VSESKKIINIDVAKILDQLGISSQFMLNNQSKQPEWAWTQAQTLKKVEFTKVLKSVNHDQTGNMNPL